MAIAPLEKVCPRCQTRFFGRKNKVFCSETCRVDANNEKMMQDYYALRGTTPTPTNKSNNANNTVGSKAHYTDKENELLTQNRKQQEEIEQLKQALAAQTVPLQHANTSNQANPSDSDKAAKLSAMKVKLAAAKVLMEKEAAELGLDMEKAQPIAERLPAAKARARELLAKHEADNEAKAEAEKLATLKGKAKELKTKLEKLDFKPTKKKKP